MSKMKLYKVPSCLHILLRCENIPLELSKRCLSSSSQGAEKWDIYAGLCLERRPVITPELNTLEKAMKKIFFQYENNHSLRSDHEIRKIRDLERQERIASGKTLDTDDLDSASLETAQDLEDKGVANLEQFKFASRKTAADEKNDRRSVERLLDRRLIFLCHQKIGSHYVWTLPFVKVENSSLRETIENFRQSMVDKSNADFRILGNAPSAVYTYKYGNKTAKSLGSIGGKVFLMKGYLLSGNFEKSTLCDEQIDDFLWLTLDESGKVLKSRLWKALQSCQIIEGYSSKALTQTIAWIERGREEAKEKMSLKE
ncbi:mitochondrial ribosomal protein L46 [Brevipalpus obovatus]|uniref:mitochondrial ribosomal protein L46 n=1 Tax=Brevipalpus obovatus TaxID=246614 RepID=UPI003D9F1C8E